MVHLLHSRGSLLASAGGPPAIPLRSAISPVALAPALQALQALQAAGRLWAAAADMGMALELLWSVCWRLLQAPHGWHHGAKQKWCTAAAWRWRDCISSCAPPRLYICIAPAPRAAAPAIIPTVPRPGVRAPPPSPPAASPPLAIPNVARTV